MIDGLKPYPEYKDSGVSWLGEIPSRWDVRRMKLLLREVDSRSANGKEQLLRVSQFTGVTQRKAIDGSDAPDTRASSLIGYKRVVVDDLVINIMLAWNGSMGISRYDGIASPAYCVYRLKSGARPWYYHELLRLPLYKGRIKTASTGVVESRLRLYSDDLGRIEAIQPPPDEQDAIVRFLDHANGRIERAIRAKQKLMALFNEQKQAIIHRAVTRGLNPNVPLKPSGIPWLGDIPKHWEVLRSKYVFREVDDRSASGKETRLSMCQKRGLIPSSEIEVKRLVSESAVGAKICEAGDLVLNRLKAHLGVFALASVRGLVSPDYTILRPARPMYARYFELLYRTPACRVELRKRAKGIVQGFWRLYTDDFYDIRLPVPSVPEQEQIVRQLDLDLATLNAALSRTEREIGLLREYRTRLVADVVTGKLDVRAAARQLPEEAGELSDGAEQSDSSDLSDEIQPE